MAAERSIEDIADARRRVERLIEAARAVTQINSPSGIQLRQRLRETTGLSEAGIELGIVQALELTPSDAELARFCSAVEAAPRTWVVLSANVFVAAHRAIALALASSERVFVRPSRRDPALAQALCEASGGLFSLVEELAPVALDHVYAYGSDETMAELRRTFPEGVVFHAHGTGMGAALVGVHDDLELAAAAIARDVVLFDQRGCLSPRIVGVDARLDGAAFSAALGRALASAEAVVPLGILTRADLAERTWYREVSAYVGHVFAAGAGCVGYFERAEQVPLPPAQRCVSVFSSADLLGSLAPLGPSLTVVASDDATLHDELGQRFPGARIARLGAMQCPPFDGPVDRRTS